jgi:hypothetical protein
MELTPLYRTPPVYSYSNGTGTYSMDINQLIKVEGGIHNYLIKNLLISYAYYLNQDLIIYYRDHSKFFVDLKNCLTQLVKESIISDFIHKIEHNTITLNEFDQLIDYTIWYCINTTDENIDV